MNWHALVEAVTPHIVKIETPSGSGTGFLCLYNDNRTFCGIATAHHVVADADLWQQPIRVSHHSASKTVLFKEGDRAIMTNPATDSAVVLLATGVFDFPQVLINLLPAESVLRIGVEVGWVGFPSVEPDSLCFFSGNISARHGHKHSYLIDGVAINGVSGGPVFYPIGGEGNTPQIIGTITAYLPNRAASGTLPGLAYAQDVSHFHETSAAIRNLDEARRQKEEIERQAKEQQAAIPPPEAPPAEPSAQIIE